jgi:hypothetical protein
MPPRVYATIGRADGNDVPLDHPTVSNHHARLSWSGSALVVEDLSSENGTFVDGRPVKRARTRAGVEIRVGAVILPWSHEGLRKLLKAGAGARTLAMPHGGTNSYVCGACGHMGILADSPMPKRMTCAACKTTLRVGTRPKSGGGVWVTAFSLFLCGAIAAGAVWWARGQGVVVAPKPVVQRVQETIETLKAEEKIGGQTADKIAKALTPMDPITRNAAVKLAARTEGPFHVEQVAEIWSGVRQAWRYVNDPAGREYFATATESIQNGYIGDCDDFAITLTSMVTAIGGRARVVLMDGPKGGHAYAEACVQGDPKKVARALATHYRTRWRRYLAGRAPTEMAHRTSDDCPIWLNLDWNSVVPGGAYEPEAWAVAIYEEGRSEPLDPATAIADAPTPAKAPSAAAGRSGR